MNIIISNDDGVYSEGLYRLYLEAKKIGNPIVVAPDRERSTISRALTMHRPFRVWKYHKYENWYYTDATPVTCVYIGKEIILENKKIDLILAGINKGPNLGEDVNYSGTLAIASEAIFLNASGIAFSLASFTDFNWDTAQKAVKLILEKYIKFGLPKRVALNVNIPNVPFEKIKGIKLTRLSQKKYHEGIVKRKDPWNRPYYWLGATTPNWEFEEGTDYWAIKNNYISITPISLDITAYEYLDSIRNYEE